MAASSRRRPMTTMVVSRASPAAQSRRNPEASDTMHALKDQPAILAPNRQHALVTQHVVAVFCEADPPRNAHQPDVHIPGMVQHHRRDVVIVAHEVRWLPPRG